MPPNSSNPLNEPISILAASPGFNASDAPANNFAPFTPQQFASPASNAQMGFDEKAELEDRAEFEGMSEGEDSMSDGGVLLEMAHSQAEVMGIELDVPDVHMNEDTFDDLLPSFFPTTLEDAFPGSPSFQQPSATLEFLVDDPSEHPSEMPTAPDPFSLPTTVSAVSLSLQQFLDEHPDDDFQINELHGQSAAEAEVANHLEYSTASISFQSSNFMNLESDGGAAHSNLHLSLPEPSPLVETITMSALDQQSSFSHVNGGFHLPPPHSPWVFHDAMSDLESQDEADDDEVPPTSNHNLIEFLSSWTTQIGHVHLPRAPRVDAISALIPPRYTKLPSIHRRDLRGKECDIQGINWSALGVSRLEARQLRRHMYRNYFSLPQNERYDFHMRGSAPGLDDDDNFFRFRKMDFEHNIRMTHFQLRNLLACSSRDHIFYTAPARVLHYNPQNNSKSSRVTVAMDFTNPLIHPFHSLTGHCQFTALAEGHDVLIAGGHDGEYGLINLKASKDIRQTEGLITDHHNGITNHIQVHLSRGSSLPVATFASNDNGVRILDISTNKFVSEHMYDTAVNCTANSPDQRLRVQVGDTTQVQICNAATGEILQSFEGHRDYGFACDWADDGWTVATGNQDKQVMIWDARKWTNSAGIAQPVAQIAAAMGGVRKLKFSPVGSGKSVLVAAEPADYVDIIDAQMFQSKQTLSFFGEISGFDFTNEGQDLIVANCDPVRGGLMEFERCDFSPATTYLSDYEDMALDPDEGSRGEGSDYTYLRRKGTDEQRRRRPAILSTNLGLF